MKNRYPTYYLPSGFDKKLTSFTDHFIQTGFGEFTDEFAKINEFVERAAEDDRSSGEKKLRCTPKEKYLLEAVSFKIYDELNREAFNRTKETVIILPDCLSGHNPDCQKEDLPYGDECRLCTDSCQANHIVKLGESYGAKVVFSKRKLAEQIKHYSDTMDDIGVVGIACLLMLASGMRTADEIEVPTRGVLLSFTGCDHWNNEAFASSIPISRLRAILEEKYGSANTSTHN